MLEQLWQLVRDPRADDAVRAASAVALRPKMTSEDLERLHWVRDATVSPKLRVAFDALLEEDANRLEEALDELPTPECERPPLCNPGLL